MSTSLPAIQSSALLKWSTTWRKYTARAWLECSIKTGEWLANAFLGPEWGPVQSGWNWEDSKSTLKRLRPGGMDSSVGCSTPGCRGQMPQAWINKTPRIASLLCTALSTPGTSLFIVSKTCFPRRARSPGSTLWPTTPYMFWVTLQSFGSTATFKTICNNSQQWPVSIIVWWPRHLPGAPRLCSLNLANLWIKKMLLSLKQLQNPQKLTHPSKAKAKAKDANQMFLLDGISNPIHSSSVSKTQTSQI